MEALAACAGLFLAAFAAATLLPAQSEALLAGLLLSGRYEAALLILSAASGNVLGSVVNWLLGRSLERFSGRRWFPVGPASLEKAKAWYRRWGRWSLLLSWLPVVGDPLTLVAGVLREPFPVFLALVTIAKLGRYLVLAALVLGWSG
ncbi:YqaA family protein [Pseudoroseomonas cervicalis]|uniref:YqaA family protein n=1 Tax=Teichococcus cervicalis TaxID=204525 RepID=UPI00278B96AE|nr:YqaA family protein [Pseudoroseomonas cervicalis]MDQ1077489.1 membrane protein YqaA with SNARE-associated domain [Pseudoroseomonas cervicalis]